jgi:AraC-like DNA-binding protein
MPASASRQEFLAALSAASLVEIYDLMPDVSFFIKDRDGRFVALNRLGCEFCGVSSEREALGRTDRDFFPASRADEYLADDRAVMASGRPMLDRIEPAPEMEGSPYLVVTNKIPLRDRGGRIVGVAGFSRRVERLRGAPAALHQLAKAVDTLHRKHADPLGTAALAKEAGLSTSQFERTFRKAFGTSPRKYLLRVRIEHACRRLSESSETIAMVAQHCGFYDHAHFTRAFVAEKGISPSRFRKDRQSPGTAVPGKTAGKS